MEKEVDEIERAFPVIRKYLNDEHLQAIDAQGLVERSTSGYTTSCVDHRACVFVRYEKGIAKCSFETSYFNKEIHWRKPLSCHLFPIRVDHGFHHHLRYEAISECQDAVKRGQNEDIQLSDFLKDSLIRAYGMDWYKDFAETCKSVQTMCRDSGLK
jgi:hypothetical protein